MAPRCQEELPGFEWTLYNRRCYKAFDYFYTPPGYQGFTFGDAQAYCEAMTGGSLVGNTH